MLHKKVKNTSSWQKMILHLEYALCNEDELCNQCRYTSKLLYFKIFFGENCLFLENSDEASEVGKASFGKMIVHHVLINLNIGVVGLKEVVDTYAKVELKMQPHANSTEKRPITWSVQYIMMGLKFNGVRLCQVVIPTDSGSWEAYYPNGKGCTNHKLTAQS